MRRKQAAGATTAGATTALLLAQWRRQRRHRNAHRQLWLASRVRPMYTLPLANLPDAPLDLPSRHAWLSMPLPSSDVVANYPTATGATYSDTLFQCYAECKQHARRSLHYHHIRTAPALSLRACGQCLAVEQTG